MKPFQVFTATILFLLAIACGKLAVRAVRLAAYLDARGGEGGLDLGHASAVTAQNEQAAKVREVLGYQHPYEEIKF